MRLRVLLVGLVAGVTFLVLDGILNANPLALRLYAAYQPIARPAVNALAASVIDLAYGVVLTWLFTRLRPSLPGRSALAKGVSFGLVVWFLRVVMRVAGEWVVTTVPGAVHVYTLVAGLIQVTIVTVTISLLLPQKGAQEAV